MSNQPWELAVTTAAEKHSGTDPEIFVQLTTTATPFETSPVIRCSDTQDKSFQVGKTDNYRFELPTPLRSPVSTIQVWHQNKGNDWSPVAMKLTNYQNEYDFNIPAGTEISPGVVHTFSTKDAKSCAYKVLVQTGNSRGAGTDADVKLNIIGAKGQTRFRKLDNKKNNFEKGALDTFTVDSVDLGEIEAVELMLCKTRTLGGDWDCESVTVNCDCTTEKTFYFKRTLTPSDKNVYVARDPTSNVTSCTRPSVTVPAVKPAHVVTVPAVKPAPVVTVPVVAPTPVQQVQKPVQFSEKTRLAGTVYTSDAMGAGTDAKVTIWVTDVNGVTAGPLQISETGGDTMEKGQKNAILIRVKEELSTLAKVSVQHGGEGKFSDWKLDKIELTATTPYGENIGKMQTFVFNKWIKAKTLYEARANQ